MSKEAREVIEAIGKQRLSEFEKKLYEEVGARLRVQPEEGENLAVWVIHREGNYADQFLGLVKDYYDAYNLVYVYLQGYRTARLEWRFKNADKK